MSTQESFQKLLNITHTLRNPEGGCPWDLKQTIQTLQSCMKEECEEVLEAIKNNDMENLQEELGDLLFNVIIMSYVAEQNGIFTVKDVIDGMSSKLIRRHPHVFGDKKAENADEALAMWNQAKLDERTEA